MILINIHENYIEQLDLSSMIEDVALLCSSKKYLKQQNAKANDYKDIWNYIITCLNYGKTHKEYLDKLFLRKYEFRNLNDNEFLELFDDAEENYKIVLFDIFNTNYFIK